MGTTSTDSIDTETTASNDSMETTDLTVSTAGSTDAIGTVETTDSTLASSGDSNAEAIVGVVLSAVAVLALF